MNDRNLTYIAEKLSCDGYIQNVTDIYTLPEKLEFDRNEKQRTYSTDAEMVKLFWKYNDREELINKLHQIAENVWNGPLEHQEPYIVSRVVTHTSINESYRSHFDSHLVTIVIPIEVPKGEKYLQGELLVQPNLRLFPNSEVVNIIQKLFYGSIVYRWYLKKNYIKMQEQNKLKVMDIGSFNNLVFNGLTTLHSNLPFKNEKTRRTLLIHYGDPNTKGIGSWVRKLRNR